MNEAACRVTRYSKEELLSKHIYDISHPDIASKAALDFEMLRAKWVKAAVLFSPVL